MVLLFSLFGKNIILPNLQGILRCFRSAKLVVYAVHAQCMQRNAVVQLGAWARGQSSPARAGIWALFRSAFPGAPPPPLPPRGAGKTGRLSGDGPCATTHSLLRLPAKHRPDRCSTQVQRKFNASSTQVQRKLLASYSQVSSLSHYVFTSFQRHSMHYLGDLHLVFTTFDAIL